MFRVFVLFFTLFIATVAVEALPQRTTVNRGVSVRRSSRLNYSDDFEATGDSLVYQPKYYRTTNIQNRNYYPQGGQNVYFSQPYYQQPAYYNNGYGYPSYGQSPGNFGFNFCLACFGFGFG
uniref:Uncharacterized protein n=1 Tax=Panagrellus redivivus TaxID=6233 RepID=A0A7E4WC48_PANRE